MALIVELGVADLAATRFAASPLAETALAIKLLAEPAPAQVAVNRPWLAWARRELDRRPLRLPAVWPLLVTGLEHYPEFLLPTPNVPWPSFPAELDRLRATPAGDVRASLERVFAGVPWPAAAADLAASPSRVLGVIAAEFAQAHSRLVEPHWEKIRSVLSADIGYRTGVLAGGGVRGLFGELHADLRWSAGRLTIADNKPDQQVQLGPDGLMLLPSVFIWPDVTVKLATSTRTPLVYPARGAAAAWIGLSDPASLASPAVEELIGAPRARLLALLRSPSSTTVLARELGVTPGAVSQHLRVLHRTGLVTSQRDGRSVLYQTSDLGMALLG